MTDLAADVATKWDDAQRRRKLAELADAESPLFRSVTAFIGSYKQKMMESGRGGALEKVPFSLTADEVRGISRVFGVEVVATSKVSSSCPAADATVYLANKVCERMKAWDGEDVVCVDGSLTQSVACYRSYWHVCRTFSTTELNAIAVRDEATLTAMARSKTAGIAAPAAAMLSTARKGATSARVCSAGATCEWRAETVVLNLLESPASMEESAEYVRRHSAVRAKGWCFFQLSMLDSSFGDLEAFPGYYSIFEDVDELHIIPASTRRTWKVYRWSDVKAWATRQVVVVGGRRYLSEVVEKKPGILFFIQTDADGDVECETVLERRYERTGPEAVDVSLKMFAPRTTSVGACTDDGRVTCRVNAEVWSKLLARAMAVPDNKLSIAHVRESVADYTQQYSAVGGVLRAPPLRELDFAEVLAQAVTRHAVLERLRMALESSDAIGCVRREWGLEDEAVLCLVARLMWDARSTLRAALASVQTSVRGYMRYVASMDYRDYIVTVAPVPREVVFEELSAQARRGGAPTTSAGGSNSGGGGGGSGGASESVRHAGGACEGGGATGSKSEFVETRVESVEPAVRDLTSDRLAVVEKVRDFSYDTVVRSVRREREVPVVYTALARFAMRDVFSGDALDVLRETFVDVFPLCTSILLDARPFTTSQDARDVDMELPALSWNVARASLPPSQQLRLSALRTDIGGPRPVTQEMTLTAVAKRMANAPNYSDPSCFESRLASDFDHFARVCLRPGWEERTKAAVVGGLWSTDEEHLRSTVARMLPSNVAKALAEDFRAADVDLTKWTLMVKRQLKHRGDDGVYYSTPASQTLVYQESKVTNTILSAKLGKFHDFLDGELEDNVRINTRRDRDDDTRWLTKVSRTYRPTDVVLEADISQCDKSQVLYNMTLYFYILRRFGAPDWLADLWEVVIGRKTASAPSVGVSVAFVYQVLSGCWATISMNSLLVSVANIVCLGVERENLVAYDCRGDDGKVVLRQLALPPVESSERYRSMFNFEAKVFVVGAPFGYGRYEVFVDGHAYIVKCPLRAIASLGKSLPVTADLREQWEAFKDDMVWYGCTPVMDALDRAHRDRHGGPSVRHALRALAACVEDFEQYARIRDGVVRFFK